MTVGEAVRAVDAYVDRRRDRAYFDYTQAMTVGLFIGSLFSSDKPPTMEQMYPDLFTEDKEEAERAVQEAKDAASAANFIKFANSFNQRYNTNGNGKSESENNS